MNQNHSPLFRRTLCAVCAFAFLLTLAGPAAYAAGEAAPAATELTRAQAAAMAQADAAMSELLDSSSYEAMSVDQRQAAAQAQLDQLASQGLVQSGSIRYDEENGMLSFTYDCGVLGGVLLTGWEEEPFVDLPLEMPAGLPGPLDAQNDVRPLGNAIIYYAFDDTVNSSRYPSYLTMQEAWNGWGLSTTLDTDVTVADLRHMDDYDLCILSTHGAYYTYTTGWLFKQVRTAPVLLLREESSFWDDLRYGFDLLTHRVIKVNGNYCVTPDFFSAAYRDGQLEGTMVFSETCEFFGGSNILDLSMSNALLDAGARAVVGFVNNVYAVYSRNMLWGTVNQLIMGQNILQAVDAAAATYGPDDIYWYLSQGGRAAPNPTATRPLPWSTGTTPPPSTPWTKARRRNAASITEHFYKHRAATVLTVAAL